VTATAPAEGWTGERTRQMVRALLADRFGLATHTETREDAHLFVDRRKELKQQLRDVRQGPDGLLYALTAEEDGALLRIEPR
jgi:uncharacterized protein (TIGR03435 family)